MSRLSVILEATLEFIEVWAAERRRRKELRSFAQLHPEKGDCLQPRGCQDDCVNGNNQLNLIHERKG